MHNLMAIAFQCDVTRVISFMMSDALSNRNLSFIPEVAALPGTDSGDHSVSHHTGRGGAGGEVPRDGAVEDGPDRALPAQAQVDAPTSTGSRC